jgi:hypothetical protein
MTSGLKGLAGLAGLGIGGGAVADQPEVTTWIANVVAAGGSVDSTNRALVNKLIADLKVDGTLATIQQLLLFGGPNSFTGAMVPLIDTLSLGNVLNGGFTSDKWNPAGLKGAGSEYVNTKYVPNDRIVSFSSVCVWTNFILDTGGSFPRLWGASNGVRKFQFEHEGAGLGQARVYSDSDNVSGAAVASGDIVVNRSSSTLLELFVNGTLATSRTNLATDLRPIYPLFIFAQNDIGTPVNHSRSRILLWSIGSSMSSGQRATMRNAIAAYKAAKGI